MATKKKPYEGTAVSVDKSMAEIMALLRTRDTTGLIWQEEGMRSSLRFRWKTRQGDEVVARFTVGLGKAPGRLTGKQLTDWPNAERRRLFRVLFFYMKNMFEAVDGGIVSLEAALLAHLEDASGSTVAEVIVPQLGRLAATPLMRALTTGGAN